MSFSALCALAYACALSDHIGLALFPHQALFRIAGRLAFPLFCFLVTECFEHTGNRRRYALTLLLLALVTEIPSDLLVFGRPLDLTELNAVFSLLLSLCAVSAYESFGGNTRLQFLSVFAFCLLALALRVSYGFLGPLLCVCYARAGTRFQRALAGFTVPLFYATVLFFGGADPAWIRVSLAASLSCIPVFLYSGRPGRQRRALHFFLYAAWPVHFLLLVLLRSTRVIPPWFLR